MTSHCLVSWCEEGDHVITPHKKLMGQWHCVSINNGQPHEITLQLEVWSRYHHPDYIRSALTLVDSANLEQLSCELVSAQIEDMSHRLNQAHPSLST